MKVRIGDHDFDITKRKTKDFLEDGDKVKVTIRFRGREQERPGFGKDLLDRLAEEVIEAGVVEQTPKIEGRSMTMVLAPTRRPRAAAEVDHEMKTEVDIEPLAEVELELETEVEIEPAAEVELEPALEPESEQQ
jgi:translation initiation factor IF-3